jgi:hypothetical protein
MEALMRRSSAAFVVLLLIPAVVRGQSPPSVSRADVAVSAGWFAADREGEGGCCGVWSPGLFKGVSGGYYWTDHLKTEATVAAPGATEGYTFFSERLANGSSRYTSEQHRYDGTKFSIAQTYQFGRNSTFHPFVTAGLDVDRERDAIDRYTSTASSAVETERVETAIRTRAFAGVGFKAYFSERAFFKGEARFAGRRRPDQMTWTAGVGVDLGGRELPGAAVETPSHAVPRGREPVDVWRGYASQLTIGALVDVTPAGSGRFVAELRAVDGDGILVKPATRVAEPLRHVTFDQLETLALHDGPRPGARVGATLAGVGAGSATFLVTLMLLLSHIGG